jgi:hypothetical protein
VGPLLNTALPVPVVLTCDVTLPAPTTSTSPTAPPVTGLLPITITAAAVPVATMVMLPALFHGMQNLVQTLFDGIDPLWMPRYRSTIDVVVSIIIVLVAGTELMRRARGTDTALS